jgi:3'-phosphoadenosine 5'-phosphosulfate sulfotransferase
MRKQLPIDMLCDIIISGRLSYSLHSRFGKRFGITGYNQIHDKVEEVRKEILENPNEHIKRIFKSKRMTTKYVESLRKRMEPEIEQYFFEKCKNDWVYFSYCKRFEIIVEEFNQIVTEVALSCKDSYFKKDYLNEILDKRKSCKNFIVQHIELLDISPTDSIQKLIESLK